MLDVIEAYYHEEKLKDKFAVVFLGGLALGLICFYHEYLNYLKGRTSCSSFFRLDLFYCMT